MGPLPGPGVAGRGYDGQGASGHLHGQLRGVVGKEANPDPVRSICCPAAREEGSRVSTRCQRVARIPRKMRHTGPWVWLLLQAGKSHGRGGEVNLGLKPASQNPRILPVVAVAVGKCPTLEAQSNSLEAGSWKSRCCRARLSPKLLGRVRPASPCLSGPRSPWARGCVTSVSPLSSPGIFFFLQGHWPVD